MHKCLCTLRPEDHLSCHSLAAIHLVSRTRFLIGLELVRLARLSGQQASLCLPSVGHWDYKHVPPHPIFFKFYFNKTCFGDSNSGLQAYKITTTLNEPALIVTFQLLRFILYYIAALNCSAFDRYCQLFQCSLSLGLLQGDKSSISSCQGGLPLPPLAPFHTVACIYRVHLALCPVTCIDFVAATPPPPIRMPCFSPSKAF